MTAPNGSHMSPGERHPLPRPHLIYTSIKADGTDTVSMGARLQEGSSSGGPNWSTTLLANLKNLFPSLLPYHLP
jgi:hypothetical protein